MAVDALASTGAGIATKGPFWKKEPAKSVEVGWIAVEYRIPSSELSEMSAAKCSESWIPFRTHLKNVFYSPALIQ
jgi:hypothetical protein